VWWERSFASFPATRDLGTRQCGEVVLPAVGIPDRCGKDIVQGCLVEWKRSRAEGWARRGGRRRRRGRAGQVGAELRDVPRSFEILSQVNQRTCGQARKNCRVSDFLGFCYGHVTQHTPLKPKIRRKCGRKRHWDGVESTSTYTRHVRSQIHTHSFIHH